MESVEIDSNNIDNFVEKPLQPEILSEILWANMRYPQDFHAQRVLAGAKAIELVVNGQMNWEDYCGASLTDEQIEAIKQKALKVHAAYGIDLKDYSSVDHSERPFINFSNETIRTVSEDGAWVSYRTIEALGHWMVTGEIPPVHRVNIRYDNPLSYRDELIEAFNNPQYLNQVHAIKLLYNRAREYYYLDETKRLAKEYRESLVKAYKNPEIKETSVWRIEKEIKAGLEDHLLKDPEITESIPGEVVNFFLKEVV